MQSRQKTRHVRVISRIWRESQLQTKHSLMLQVLAMCSGQEQIGCSISTRPEGQKSTLIDVQVCK